MLRLSNRETNEMGIALPQRSSSSLQFRVEAVGDDVRNLSVGDRVIVYAKQGMGDYYELPTDSNLILLREEFIAGLEEVPGVNRYRSGAWVYALCSRLRGDLVPDINGDIVCYATDAGWREADAEDAEHYGAFLRAQISEDREQTDEEFEANEAAAADLDIVEMQS